MEKRLELKEVLDDGGDVQNILLIDENEKPIADLSSNAREDITEANFIDTNNDDYIEAGYVSDITGYDCRALFNSKGKLIRKGIFNFVRYVEARNEFILCLNASESEYYEFKRNYADYPDFLFCVINSLGEYIIEPIKEEIEYNETDDAYLIGEK